MDMLPAVNLADAGMKRGCFLLRLQREGQQILRSIVDVFFKINHFVVVGVDGSLHGENSGTFVNQQQFGFFSGGTSGPDLLKYRGRHGAFGFQLLVQSSLGEAVLARRLGCQKDVAEDGEGRPRL